MVKYWNVRLSRAAKWACVLLGAATVTGCSGSSRRQSSAIEPRTSLPPRITADPPRLEASRADRGGGTYKIGKPYSIRGRWYVPAEDPNFDRSGVASWYGPDFHGKKTANGETFDMHGLTAAHTTLPLPSYVYVTNLANGRTVLVRVNDRGPYVHGRLIDLSKGVARLLGTETNGIGQVRVRYAGRAPLDGSDVAERQFLVSQSWYSPGSNGLGSNGLAGRMALGGTHGPLD